MKVWKLVSGILCCCLFVVTTFQSCAATIGNGMDQNGEIGGVGGFILSILMLAGGIVSIVAYRNANSKGLNITLIILFGLASIIGFSTAGSFGDLNLWAFWCLICAVLAAVSLFKKKKTEPGK